MPDSSVFQNDFRGGEWGETSQARSDDPQYKTALAVALNVIPIEEGSITRRPGFQRLGPTYLRKQAKLLDFMSASTCSFACEFTPNILEFWSGTLPIFTNDGAVTTAASYSANKITLTFASYPGSPQWAVGDTVLFKFEGSGLTVAQEAFCRGRFFQITARNTSSHTITLGDDLGNPIFLSTFASGALVGITVYRILRFSTSYGTSALPSLRLVQAQTQAIILSNTVAPQTLQVTEPNGSNDPTFTFGATMFLDGPYLDPQSDIGTLSALSGSVTFTPSGPSYSFVASDVGRMIRITTQPPAWNSGTTYAAGAFVTYAGQYWQSIASGLYASSNVNVIPGTPLYTAAGVQVPLWVPAPQALVVIWGTISSQAGTNATFTVQLVDGATAPPAGNVVQQWQLGVYTASTFPTCGVYYEGRLFLGGAVPNRFDASMANGIAQSPLSFAAGVAMSPTDQNGNVNDNCGISETLNGSTLNTFEWMIGDQQGIIVGCLEAEWLIAASALGDPITPTSIQAHQITRYGDAFVEPRRAGIAMIFVQRYGRRILEYLADTFSQRFSGLHVNEHAKHMTTSGVNELRYQEEAAPLIWAAMNNGDLSSCLYRRKSRFVTENPLYNGWTRHIHGAPGSAFASIVTLPAGNDLGDNLYAAIADAGGYWMEVLRELPETTDTALQNHYLDSHPGNPNEGVLTKCGFLIPSAGMSATTVFSGSDWSNVSNLPGNSTVPAGTTIPPSPSPSFFAVLKDATYFNGLSGLFNLGLGSANAISLSFWIYVDGSQGTVLSTNHPGPFSGENLTGVALFANNIVEISSVVGLDPLGQTMWTQTSTTSFNGSGVGQILQIVPQASNVLTNPKQWVHVMISSGNGGTGQCWINDTEQLSATSGFDWFLSFKVPTVINGATVNCDFSKTVLGGPALFQGTANNPGDSITGQNSFFVGPTESLGLRAGIYDLWINLGTTVDWSVKANRYAFHTTDLAALRYAPVNLGKHGELPLGGTRPTMYFTGPPTVFNTNRANGLQASCYNLRGVNFDPTLTQLDSLPSYISPPT